MAIENIIGISGGCQVLNVNYVTVCIQLRLPDYDNCVLVMEENVCLLGKYILMYFRIKVHHFCNFLLNDK